MYLRVEQSMHSSSFDVYYHEIDESDNTWKSVLSAIESELDSHFVNNEESLIGIKFSIEIVDELPDDIEEDY